MYGIHHPAHLGPPLLPSGIPGVNSALPMIGSSPLTASVAMSSEGRRTPTSLAMSSSAPSISSQTSSAFSRTSPSVQFSHPSAHRPQSPSQPPSNLTRGSPLHLHHSSPAPNSSSAALSAAAAAAAERDRQAMLRQQSPPTSSAPLSMMSTPLNKMYGQQVPTSTPNQIPTSQSSHTPQNRSMMSTSPPPSAMAQHHLRPGTSPPVIRHPQMPLPLPLITTPGTIPTPIGMHPHSPYSHHLIHPMFYSHHQNPFNSPYPYQPYPPNFQYMKPPGAAIETGMLHHPAQVPSRCEEPSTDKSASSNMQHKIKPPTQKTPQGNNSGSGSTGNSATAFSSPHQYPPSGHGFGDASKTSHIEALRAHAHSASSGLGTHHSTEPVHVDIEPDSEPEIPSPTHNIPRGPSPEAKPDDTECHRSQSAM